MLETVHSVLVLGAVVLGLGAWMRHQTQQAAAQRRRMADWAAADGWTWVASDSRVPRLTVQPPYSLSLDVPGDVLRGTVRDLPAVAYTDAVLNGRSRTSVQVVAVRLPVPLPFLQVSPVVWGSWLGERGTDVDLESARFNETYEVRTELPRYGHAVVHPRLMERLLAEPAPGLGWRTEGEWLWSWGPGPVDLDLVRRRLALLEDVVASIPRHVWDDAAASRAVALDPDWLPDARS
ncbi:hypothetical protein [Cellulomonas sp. ICMP 17802]|uniref:hypothetical protein n=1 Tax=Cellulomonas sp. ICMP 17802 TaxID=3239199 RepID=UPI00351B09C7